VRHDLYLHPMVHHYESLSDKLATVAGDTIQYPSGVAGRGELKAQISCIDPWARPALRRTWLVLFIYSIVTGCVLSAGYWVLVTQVYERVKTTRDAVLYCVIVLRCVVGVARNGWLPWWFDPVCIFLFCVKELDEEFERLQCACGHGANHGANHGHGHGWPRAVMSFSRRALCFIWRITNAIYIGVLKMTLLPMARHGRLRRRILSTGTIIAQGFSPRAEPAHSEPLEPPALDLGGAAAPEADDEYAAPGVRHHFP
jgi:hypothetical protein